MGKVKNLWEDKIEEIFSKFTSGKATRQETYDALIAIGYPTDNLTEHLDALASDI